MDTSRESILTTPYLNQRILPPFPPFSLLSLSSPAPPFPILLFDLMGEWYVASAAFGMRLIDAVTRFDEKGRWKYRLRGKIAVANEGY